MSDGASAEVSTASSKLRELVRAQVEPPAPAAEEACDLCSQPVEAVHRHLIDVRDRRILCACRPCSILFDHRGAGGGHFKLVPDRPSYLERFDLDDGLWHSLGIPVELAFFFENSATGRVAAFYPAPVGATESLLELADWNELVARNPVLEQLQPDVEALLVDRTRDAPEGWIVPVDRCYALVGLMRMHWQGFGGGNELWREIDSFFDRLRRDATVRRRNGEESTWR